MDRPANISKNAASLRLTPNFSDYEGQRADFGWDSARRAMQGLPGGGLNIAHEAVDRHAAGELADRVAFRFLSASGPTLEYTYAQLAARTDQFASMLRKLGVAKGDRVFLLSSRIPELYVAMLGALKCGCVVSPLFPAFGPEPIATRINLGEGKVLVTTPSLYLRKVAPIRDRMPTLRHVLLAPDPGASGDQALPDETLELRALMDAAPTGFSIEPTAPTDPALLHFTSGTTGTPKGAVHVHEAALTHWSTGLYALDLHPQDRFWCTADPGWVTGTSYGIIAPLLHGVTSIIDREEFDAVRWYELLASEHVSVWYTAPTAIRMLMKSGKALAAQYAYPALRFIASVGEPLNPEAVWWGDEVFGLPIHDNWWQTETGGIMIANTAAFEVRPGSMGRPLPGVEAFIVEHLEAEGEPPRVRIIDQPNVEGELALRAGWPSMFRAYLNNEQRYRKCFAGDLYLTGDVAKRDVDGYFWFVARADDVIKSAGHLIGPFEVESVLMEHPAVAEAGVIGKPDPTVGEIVKAFVSLKPGHEDDPALRRELLGHARKRLGAAVSPKQIDVLPTLPRTRSGKIMRRLLKARELGLPEGDTSTLEAGA